MFARLETNKGPTRSRPSSCVGVSCFGVIQDTRRSKNNTDSGIVDPPFLNEAENETLVRHDLKVDFPRISEVAKIVIFTA